MHCKTKLGPLPAQADSDSSACSSGILDFRMPLVATFSAKVETNGKSDWPCARRQCEHSAERR